ncbi:TPA: Ion channel protein, partial [Streptococcus suis]
TKLDILMAKIDEQNETLLRLEKKIESLEKLGELQGRD